MPLQANREKGRREFIMKCQANNPLGLFNVASGNAVGAEITVPTAKQALQLSKATEIAGMEENPPVYAEQDLFSSQTAIADPSFWPKPEDTEKGFDFARCYQCFDAIVPSVERGQSGRACRKGARLYHSECAATLALLWTPTRARARATITTAGAALPRRGFPALAVRPCHDNPHACSRRRVRSLTRCLRVRLHARGIATRGPQATLSPAPRNAPTAACHWSGTMPRG